MENKRRFFKKFNLFGFTLIELLAIIVILAIIAVITVPIILNVINNAKKGSAKDSAYGYKDSINKFYVSEMLTENRVNLNDTYDVSDGKLGEYDIPLSGTKPENGTLTFENNVLKNGCLTIDGFKVTFTDGEVTDVVKGNCEGTEDDDSNIGSSFTSDEMISNRPTGLVVRTLENKTYVTGDAIENFGGYKWHVIADYGDKVLLLMDFNQLEYRSHCPGGKSGNSCPINESGYYVYSWKDSAIQKYLNTEFYNELSSNIDHNIISESVCNAPSTVGDVHTYGGYLQKEVESLKASFTDKQIDCLNNDYSDYNVRLISRSEFTNLVTKNKSDLPKYYDYSTYDLSIASISEISYVDSNIAKTWLYDYKESWFIEGNDNYREAKTWYTMSSVSYKNYSSMPNYAYQLSVAVNDDNVFSTNLSEFVSGVRPVILVEK